VKERLRIVVSGLLGSLPLAGLTSHYVQYVLGLRQLGHEVLYLEDTGWWWDPWSRTYWDEWTTHSDVAASHPSAFLDRLMREFDMADWWTYVDIHGEVAGRSGARLAEFLSTADLFVHVTGGGRMKDEYMAIPRRAYVDTDPGYFQIWAAICNETPEYAHLTSMGKIRAHTSHFSYGRNIGLPGCSIPDLGFTWHPTTQPLVLSLWPVARPALPGAPYTTVIKWRPYGPLEYRGRTYGLKDLEFRKFVDLPSVAPVSLELASEGDPPVPPAALRQRGWGVREAWEASDSLTTYRSYIHASRGEWCIAKNIYVDTWSGWFSERSAVYLASGRPVLAQSTGFETWLPVREGLLSFSTPDEAVAGFEAIEANYARHCRVAREIAEAHFRAETVLQSMLDTALALADPADPSSTAESQALPNHP
jgi:hypothetical protein